MVSFWRRRALCVSLLALMIGVTTLRGQDEPAKLGIDLDATYASKYIWRGYDLFDDHAAFQPSVNILNFSDYPE